MARPGYVAYRNTLRALHLEPVEIACGPETRFQLTAAQLEALDPAPAGVIIASPANPTGTVIPDAELAAIAARHGLATIALQSFVDGILDRMIFDGEHLSDLMAPLDLGWKARTQAELALMADLHPLLTKRAGGRDISGLSAYEQ